MIGEETKGVIDAIAVGGTVGTLAGWLPPLAALATIIWTCIRIIETKTVQKLLKNDEE
jgi:hypothetical protein|tara:strand:- start:414 stop:587 length:174 start_codon:yes stop_codon:yes gene_type:complete